LEWLSRREDFMKERDRERDALCIKTIRMLSVDMVEAAKSGHPGLPLGAAAVAYVLWTRFLRHNPANPAWPNRDRFILSAGHGSALLYSLLHLTGYDLPLEELRRFRQWGSRTPGHPEHGLTPGVEATTGPLGQGFGMGVGMAMAARFLGGSFNRPSFPVLDPYIYALVSDGDLMEGVASEAASLAGTLGLGRLIYLYDDNRITIDGDTGMTFREDAARRFEAYNWHVRRLERDTDLEAIAEAIREARQEEGRPSLILVRTHIGCGSPRQDSPKAHGEPLGPEATRETKKRAGWPLEPTFHIPEEALGRFREALDKGARAEREWRGMFEEYRRSFPEEADRFERQFRAELPEGWDLDVPVFKAQDGPIATRDASGKVMNALAARVPNLLGGSADLAGSVKTLLAGHDARNIHFGVREHAMGAIVNGMALFGGLIPYGSTFLVFSDFLRPAMRLAALMRSHSLFVYSHDSIAVGEDGPTHQPVEQLASMRAMPSMTVLRPADANETAAAWKVAISRPGPAALILTRQKVPVLDVSAGLHPHPMIQGVSRGAYVLSDCIGEPEVILIATGSEVHLALEARARLQEEGIKARVVSMPSWELFAEQPHSYRDSVLPPECRARLAIEAGSPVGWHRWVGHNGDVIAVDRFGTSAPGERVYREYGFTTENVLAKVRRLLGR
jgi:transketolase